MKAPWTDPGLRELLALAVVDGEVGQQAFAVIREAIRKEGMVALGKGRFELSGTRHRTRTARQGAPRDYAAISV
jgi:hypothetical protein